MDASKSAVIKIGSAEFDPQAVYTEPTVLAKAIKAWVDTIDLKSNMPGFRPMLDWERRPLPQEACTRRLSDEADEIWLNSITGNPQRNYPDQANKHYWQVSATAVPDWNNCIGQSGCLQNVYIERWFADRDGKLWCWGGLYVPEDAVTQASELERIETYFNLSTALLTAHAWDSDSFCKHLRQLDQADRAARIFDYFEGMMQFRITDLQEKIRAAEVSRIAANEMQCQLSDISWDAMCAQDGA